VEKTEGTGERVGGYRVVRRLATGGTSDVLLAKAEGPHGFERSVVLKLLLSQYKHDDDFKRMFAREAAAYARLSHPSIVRLYDFFANGDQLVMVLEYIDGPPLSRLRGMLKAVGQTFDDGTSIFVAGCIFDALAAAHAATDDAGEPAPVIHRDVNPSNVLIPWDGQVKLADFGIAKVAGVSHQSSAGLIKGTYGYMAPEQVKGETVTPRADVYAGALILWEMLTKRRAFIRGALPEIEVLRELAEPRIVSIDVIRPDLDKSLRDAIKRALVPGADKRSMTAEEMVSILRALVPSEEGREKLAKALAAVRHEPKPAATSIPPADETTAKVPPPRGMLPAKPGLLPKLTPAPRPAINASPRTTAAYGAPRPPSATMKRPPSGAMPRAPLGPPPGRDDAPVTEASPRSEPGLSALLEPSDPYPLPIARDSERLRLGTPLAAIAPGRPLHDAIDEILRDLPSNVPPNVFPKTDPPGGIPGTPPPDRATLAAPEPRALGALPPAPEPLNAAAPDRLDSTLVMDTAQAGLPRPIPSSFPAMNRTLAMYERVDVRNPSASEVAQAEKATERPPPQHASPSTSAMPPVAPPTLSPSTAKVRAFVVPPAAVGSSPPGPPAPGSSPPATLPLGAMSPHPGAPPPHAAPPVGSYSSLGGTNPGTNPGASASASGIPRGPQVITVPPNHSGSLAGAHASIPSESVHTQRRGAPVLALVAVLLVAISAGVAGVVGYVRWQKSHIVALVPVPTATLAAPAAPPSVSAQAAASSTAHSPFAPPDPLPPPAPAPASALASASASASTAPADELPPGTGRVKTSGAAPGRRIFVDERTVGQTPEAVVVKCGSRAIRLGSAGTTRTVDVPCGGEITVADR
jgi:serine/threonine protein kinase